MSYKGHYSDLSEETKERLRENTRNWRRTHLTSAAANQKKFNQRVKIEVLTYYGKGKLVCVRCGFSEVDALCLDHVDGKGTQARKNGHQAGVRLYRRLRGSGFPKGYQTLCANCNILKMIREDLKHGISPDS